MNQILQKNLTNKVHLLNVSKPVDQTVSEDISQWECHNVSVSSDDKITSQLNNLTNYMYHKGTNRLLGHYTGLLSLSVERLNKSTKNENSAQGV